MQTVHGFYRWGLRWVFGIEAALNREQQMQVNQLGTELGAFLIVFGGIENLLFWILTTRYAAGGVLSGLLGLNLLVLLGVLVWLRGKVRHWQLNELTVDGPGYDRNLRQARRQGLASGSATGIGILVVRMLATGEILGDYIWWFAGLAVICGLLAGYDRYTTLRNRLHRRD